MGYYQSNDSTLRISAMRRSRLHQKGPFDVSSEHNPIIQLLPNHIITVLNASPQVVNHIPKDICPPPQALPGSEPLQPMLVQTLSSTSTPKSKSLVQCGGHRGGQPPRPNELQQPTQPICCGNQPRGYLCWVGHAREES